MGAKTSLPLTCLDVQRSYNNSMSSSSNALAAVGDAHGVLHVCRLSRLQAASASALNAAAALPPDVREALMDPVRWARRAMAVEGVPTGAGAIPSASAAAGPGGASVLRLDTQEQLRSCCWLQRQHNAGTAASSGSEGVLVTSGRSGLVKRVFAEVRCWLEGCWCFEARCCYIDVSTCFDSSRRPSCCLHALLTNYARCVYLLALPPSSHNHHSHCHARVDKPAAACEPRAAAWWKQQARYARACVCVCPY